MIKRKIIINLILAFLFCSSNSFSFANPFVYSPSEIENSANKYIYNESTQYQINTRVGFITDLILREGERIQKVAAGDSSLWAIDADIVNDIQHLYIKPLEDNIQTNIIINTNIRSYRLIVTARNDMEYVVKWLYPNEEQEEYNRRLAKSLEKDERDIAKIKEAIDRSRKFSFSYVVKKNINVTEKYLPYSVFDDGDKTYISVNEANKNNLPVIYYFDEWDKKKLQIVNYRIKGNLLEVDRIMDNFKIAYSQNSYLIIKREDKVGNAILKPKQINLKKNAFEESRKLTTVKEHPDTILMPSENSSKNISQKTEKPVEKSDDHTLQSESPGSTQALLDELNELINEVEHLKNMQENFDETTKKGE